MRPDHPDVDPDVSSDGTPILTPINVKNANIYRKGRIVKFYLEGRAVQGSMNPVVLTSEFYIRFQSQWRQVVHAIFAGLPSTGTHGANNPYLDLADDRKAGEYAAAYFMQRRFDASNWRIITGHISAIDGEGNLVKFYTPRALFLQPHSSSNDANETELVIQFRSHQAYLEHKSDSLWFP